MVNLVAVVEYLWACRQGESALHGDVLRRLSRGIHLVFAMIAAGPLSVIPANRAANFVHQGLRVFSLRIRGTHIFHEQGSDPAYLFMHSSTYAGPL